ncbi:MAG TPA: HAMP domain-containing sensor histidine kinase [Dokdonella sp.]|uniref:sensor histidine kinase n=1 Tax=Dokdonella sp. TaxID=2291710 RepID=UPI002D7F8915|nr:HAMP domain-containing sensor histidine kinase [Dokdonella sp.]HET9033171.1 HAMP domain-containing sensor histidine kinase [Dokdonella sp.]
MSNTLTWRVTWAMTATVALFVGLMAALAFTIMYQQEDELADQLVQIEMRRLIERLDLGEIDATHQPIEIGPRTEAWIADGFHDKAMPAALRGLSGGPHELELADRVLHATVAESPVGHLTVVFDATPNEARVSQFGLIMLVLWSACVIAGYWLARATAAIVVGRMHAITERIASWDPGTSHTDERRATSSDEAGRLLEAFNRMQDRVDRSIAREREFAANLSHEVRTPLAALRTDIEMAGLDTQSTTDQRQRYARMAQMVDEVSATIQAARAMSSPHAASNRQHFDLHELIDDVCSTLGVRAESAGLQMRNEVPHASSLRAERYALLIVLRNLIGNAIDHAAPATLSIRRVDQGLLIADDGPGIDQDDLPFVFERYQHGRLLDQAEPGQMPALDHGLGLAIARRVCEQQGWLISVSSETEGEQRGTRFHIAFDENST